jgi:hypothetical protein
MQQMPTTWAEVNELSALALNGFCNEYGVCLTWPKSVKIKAVCHCLGISTAGSSVCSCPDRQNVTWVRERERE